jgi:Ca2+-binding RTX toxin-like protein
VTCSTRSGEVLVGDSSSDNPSHAGDGAVRGGGGADSVFGDNIGAFSIATVGTAGGDDRLQGDRGDDALFGGPADDNLHGGVDTDSCDGEAGENAFTKCETVSGSPEGG